VFTRWNTGKGGKPFPKLERLLIAGRKPSREPQSTEHMKMIAKMWTRSHGGKIVQRKKEG
jgi:hypothetical protein